MSLLISSTELASFVSGVRDHFQTFAQFHLLTVIKEPIKTIIDNNDSEYNGYGASANPANFTLTPQSGQYRCMTHFPDNWKDDEFVPIPDIILRGDLVIKVEQDASDYIMKGKTNFFIVDNENYTFEGGPLPKSYGTQNYYYYSLKRTT